MKVIFLDHDGVICLNQQAGGRFKKRKKYLKTHPFTSDKDMPVHYRFDNFDKKAIKILNLILEETGAEIVVSSDWWKWCTVEEMGEFYEDQGIIKKPIDYTPDCPYKANSFRDIEHDYEAAREWEIKEWLKNHTGITHWVAIDDLDMSEKIGDISGNYQHGLKNFVLTPKGTEGIKQSGIKEKILAFLK